MADRYADVLKRLPVNTAYLNELSEQADGGIAEDGRRVTLGGIIVETHSKATRKGAMMGFFTLEDQTGQVEGLMFPKVYERYGRSLAADQAVLVTGRLSVREDEDIKLLADTVEPLTKEAPPREEKTDAQTARDAGEKIYLRMKREQLPRVQALLSRMAGDIPVYINLPDEGITLLCPRSLWVRGSGEAQTALAGEIAPADMKVVRKA